MTIASKGVMMTKMFAFILLLAVSFSINSPTYYPNGLNTSRIETDELVLTDGIISTNMINVSTLNVITISAPDPGVILSGVTMSILGADVAEANSGGDILIRGGTSGYGGAVRAGDVVIRGGSGRGSGSKAGHVYIKAGISSGQPSGNIYIQSDLISNSNISSNTIITGVQPEPTAQEGMMWYDTVTKTMNYYNGTSWVYW